MIPGGEIFLLWILFIFTSVVSYAMKEVDSVLGVILGLIIVVAASLGVTYIFFDVIAFIVANN